MLKKLGLGILVLGFLVIGASSVSAADTITVDHDSITSGTSLTLTGTTTATLNGAAGSAIAIGSATTTGAIGIGAALTEGTLTLGKSDQTGNVVIYGGITGGANSLFNNVTTSTIAIGGALTSGTLTLGKSTQTGATTIYGGSTTNAVRLLPVVGAVATEAHAVDVVSGGELSSGDNLVGVNVVLTPTGTAGQWASAVYGKTVQTGTKTVNGYISGGEFEVADTNAAPSEVHTLVLDGNSTVYDANSSYIWVQDFGATDMPNLFKISGDDVGSTSATTMFSTYPEASEAVTHSLKVMIDGTPYWIMMTNVAPH